MRSISGSCRCPPSGPGPRDRSSPSAHWPGDQLACFSGAGGEHHLGSAGCSDSLRRCRPAPCAGWPSKIPGDHRQRRGWQVIETLRVRQTQPAYRAPPQVDAGCRARAAAAGGRRASSVAGVSVSFQTGHRCRPRCASSALVTPSMPKTICGAARPAPFEPRRPAGTSLGVLARRAIGRPLVPSGPRPFEMGTLFWRRQFNPRLARPDMADCRACFDSVHHRRARRPGGVAPCRFWRAARRLVRHPRGHRSPLTLLYLHGGGYAFYGRGHAPLHRRAGALADVPVFAPTTGSRPNIRTRRRSMMRWPPTGTCWPAASIRRGWWWAAIRPAAT